MTITDSYRDFVVTEANELQQLLLAQVDPRFIHWKALCVPGEILGVHDLKTPDLVWATQILLCELTKRGVVVSNDDGTSNAYEIDFVHEGTGGAVVGLPGFET
jgi:hypothetical protein